MACYSNYESIFCTIHYIQSVTSEYILWFGMCHYLYISLHVYTLNKMCAAMTMSTHCQVISLSPVYRNECLYRQCVHVNHNRVVCILYMDYHHSMLIQHKLVTINITGHAVYYYNITLILAGTPLYTVCVSTY